MTTNNLTQNGRLAAHTGWDVSGVDVGVIGVTAPARPRCPQGTRAQGVERWVWTAMEDYAALVRDRTALRAGCLCLARGGADTMAARIAGLPARVSVVFVVGMGASESACVQFKTASLGGPLVISEADVLTAALGAAAISTLRCRGVTLRRGQIVVSNPKVLPRLGPLLLTAGVETLTTWNERDAQDYSLRALMAHHDILIDLAGTAPDTAAAERTLTLPREPFDYGALVLPGLLSALCAHNAASLTIDVLAACARALARLTPPDHILPALTEPLQVSAVAKEVAMTLGEHPPHRRRASTPPHPNTQHQQPEGQPS
ncbi:hypothetical protein [Mycobacterium intracellulare]|uniref:hypothetical protein n=1 Tax=Mycobacterium intracellulare TaxID=1767 RepID=UPI00109EB29A|nr:hypothetical protein [Mycobacterium intracellulare]